jgi:hypothetical protein
LMSCPTKQDQACEFSLFFPKDALVSVKEKNEVAQNQLLATFEEESFYDCDLADFFKAEPDKIKDFLNIAVGDKIEKGQIIASQKGLFAKTLVYTSPSAGTVSELTDAGILKIKTKGQKKEVLSPFKGEISKIGDIFLTVQFEAIKILACEGNGPSTCGELEVLEKDNPETEIGDINVNQEGKILAFKGQISHGFFHKAIALGVKGLIGECLNPEINDGEIAVLGLYSKEGQISDEIWETLKKAGGKQVVISGKEKYLAIQK